MINRLPPPTNTVPPPPPLPEPRTPEEITCRPPPPEVNSQPHATSNEVRPRETPTRLCFETTQQQLQLLQELATNGQVLSIEELCRRTRMTKMTLRRHLKRLENGEDIAKKPKRGRKPKYPLALLKNSPRTSALRTKHCERRRLPCTTRTSTMSLKELSLSFQSRQSIHM